MGKQFSFKKAERLAGEKHIKELFEKGSSFHLYPFRVLFLPHPDTSWPFSQTLISVPKGNFKRAVDRNKIKRRIREGYRLNKHTLEGEQKWLIAYIYTAKDIQESPVIHEKILATLGKLNAKAK